MASPFNIDIRPRRLPVEIKQIEEASEEHGKLYVTYSFGVLYFMNSGKPSEFGFFFDFKYSKTFVFTFFVQESTVRFMTILMNLS